MEIGALVAGRYEIAEVIGRGGMATVYRAHDHVLERDVALKILDERRTSDPAYVERFRREARAIAQLSHPNIVTVIDRGEFGGCEFIVFELVRGENLKEHVSRRGPLPVAEALALAHQAARGLAFAHEHGIVHRDVKPQNVLVNEDGVAKVTDFGVARLAGNDGLTLTGTILGTGDYLSPEQALGHRVDERSDQYSFGALLYELLTGEVPYPADGVVAAATRHVHDRPPSVRERRPDAPERVDALVRRAMAKDADERFPSLDALLAALEAAMREDALGASVDDDGATAILSAPRAASSAEPFRKREEARRRGRMRMPGRLVAGLAVLLAAALVVGALATGRWDPNGSGKAAGEDARVRLRAVSDYDPVGGDGEHPELVQDATDGDRTTYWRTEIYRSEFDKQGVGIVVDAGAPRELDSLVLVTDTPGFTATIEAGTSVDGRFEEVAGEQETSARTTFDLDTDGRRFRYYVVWITDLDEVAHVNEVRAA
ncbi:MAG: protein kinase [Actinomycetota bacterium]|nr:protein kinase [Actinomycetota bacterium]